MTSGSVHVLEGDLFASKAQTLVNTVNCVGVMGKGVALGFRRRFPEMFDDYVGRCERNEVTLGRPYLYKRSARPWILNFPTKDHWRSMSRLGDIESGLKYLAAHYKEWGVQSLAVPPLGAGNGGLEWRVVGPTLYHYLDSLDIPVELYVPHGTPHEQLQPTFLDRLFPVDTPPSRVASDTSSGIGAPWIALLEALSRIEREPYHWPIGRILFQKLAYFATQTGIPLHLHFRRSSFGPYAPDLKPQLSRLLNNGLIEEHQRGQMFEVRVGRTFEDARHAYNGELSQYLDAVDRLVDLMARMTTRDAEMAASVHFVAGELWASSGGEPTEVDIYKTVLDWKQRRKPALRPHELAGVVRSLNSLGWIDAKGSADLDVVDEFDLLAAEI